MLGDSDTEDPSPRGDGGKATTELKVGDVSDIDPYGDGSEHPETAGDAADGDPTTAWQSENYRSSIVATKGDENAGIGLVFDLGSEAEVGRIEIEGSLGTVEIRAGGENGTTEEAFDVVTKASDVLGSTEITVDGTAARYWLIWITDLPGAGTGSAQIAEVRFFGP